MVTDIGKKYCINCGDPIIPSWKYCNKKKCVAAQKIRQYKSRHPHYKPRGPQRPKATWFKHYDDLPPDKRLKIGFALLNKEERIELAKKGGIASHLKLGVHEWTSEEAKWAGKKGRESRNKLKQ